MGASRVKSSHFTVAGCQGIILDFVNDAFKDGDYLGEIGLADVENGFSIQFEIVVSDDVSHSFCAFPVDYRGVNSPALLAALSSHLPSRLTFGSPILLALWGRSGLPRQSQRSCLRQDRREMSASMNGERHMASVHYLGEIPAHLPTDSAEDP